MGCNCTNSKSIVLPTMKQSIHGAKVIIQNKLGLGLIDSATMDKRKSICMNCDKLNKGMVNQCIVCSCIIEQKAMNKFETCPLTKW